MAAMGARGVATRLAAIRQEGYASGSYSTGRQFVRDVAALCKTYPAEMTRRLPKGGTVLASLSAATTPVALEYLMNGPRFFARNPNVPHGYGTTKNKAFHRQLKSFFRNITQQSGRNAQVVAGVATLAKLVAGHMSRAQVVREIREKDLIACVSTMLDATPPQIQPTLAHKSAQYSRVSVRQQTALPPNAKKSRKV